MNTPADRVRLATTADLPGFLGLAGQVERWFGPMVDVAGFHNAVKKSAHAGTALCVDGDSGLDGGILCRRDQHNFQISWLVVSASVRGTGIGSALVRSAVSRFVTAPDIVEVVTFGADHPSSEVNRVRRFYLNHGFTAAEQAQAGPDGTSRQWFRLAVR